MPLKVVVVTKDELYGKLREYEKKGYSCKSDEDGDWECAKRINELLFDIHYILVVY